MARMKDHAQRKSPVEFLLDKSNQTAKRRKGCSANFIVSNTESKMLFQRCDYIRYRHRIKLWNRSEQLCRGIHCLPARAKL